MSTGHCWHDVEMPSPFCCQCYDNTVMFMGMTVQCWEVCWVTPTLIAVKLLNLTFRQLLQEVDKPPPPL